MIIKAARTSPATRFFIILPLHGWLAHYVVGDRAAKEDERRGRSRQRREFLRLVLGGPSGRVGYRVDMAAEQCIDRVCYTLECHADPSNTLLLPDLRHGGIRQAVPSGYSIIDLAWPRFRICQELKKCSPGRVASHRDAKGVSAYAR